MQQTFEVTQISEEERQRLSDEMKHNILWAQVMSNQNDYPYGMIIFVNQPK